MDKTTLKIYQLKNGYCYNSDSLFLYGFITRFLKANASLLDVGAGSGVLGLLCARDFHTDTKLIDINEAHFKLCKKNALENNIKCEILCGNVLESHFKNIDFIISNPPFYDRFSPPPKNHHLFLAKKEENLPFKQLALFAKKALHQKGKFIFCYKSTDLSEIMAVLRDCGFNISAMQFIYPKKIAKHNKQNASLTMLCCDFSKKKLEILPPIFNFINSSHSKEAREIFTLCNLESVKIDEDSL